MRKCEYCQKEFEPKNAKGRFCSDKCRVYSNRESKNKKSKKKSQPVREPRPLFNKEAIGKRKEEIEKKPATNMSYQQSRLNKKLGLK